MYGIGHPLPGGDLYLIPDARDVAIAARLRGNECCFGDQESPGNGSTLGVAGVRQRKPLNREERYVLFSHKWKWDMLVVGTESSQWCHNNPILQLQVAQLEGLEEV